MWWFWFRGCCSGTILLYERRSQAGALKILKNVDILWVNELGPAEI